MPRWMSAIAAVMLAALAMSGGAGPVTAAVDTKTAIFAGGCFWCVEAAFDEVDGVTETVSGYAGGTKPNPTYGDHEGYQEAVKVTYDPAKVTYAKLLDTYWHNIDPFDPDGQFCDEGNAYRSVIFVGDDEEKRLAESTKQQVADRFKETVATEIKPATTFTAAEDYHQNYHNTNPVSYKFYKWNCGARRDCGNLGKTGSAGLPMYGICTEPGQCEGWPGADSPQGIRVKSAAGRRSIPGDAFRAKSATLNDSARSGRARKSREAKVLPRHRARVFGLRAASVGPQLRSDARLSG